MIPIFPLPQGFLARDERLRSKGKADVFVVINERLDPDFAVTQNNALAIAGRSFTTASRARSRATLTATEAISRRSGIGFNLTYIDESGPSTTAARGFDTAYMRNLYNAGYEKGRTGHFWQHSVSGSPTTTLMEAAAGRRERDGTCSFDSSRTSDIRRLLAQDLGHEPTDLRSRI